MKTMSIMFVATVCFAGCSKKTPDVASGGSAASASGGAADCDKAISHGMELGKDDLPATDAKMMAQLHDIGVKHCVNDKWSDDAVKCMIDAKAKSDSTACYGKLTAEQQKAMNDEAMTVGNASGSAAAPQ